MKTNCKEKGATSGFHSLFFTNSDVFSWPSVAVAIIIAFTIQGKAQS